MGREEVTKDITNTAPGMTQDSGIVSKLKKKSINKPEMSQKTDKTDKEPHFGTKLKKTETLKIKIQETKLEPVSLKHHEFERDPKESISEKTSNINLGDPLHYSDNEKLEEDK